MTQVLRMINGVDNKHHDYDYTQALVRLAMDKWGVGFLGKVAWLEFDLDIANQVIKPWVAFILCTRSTSSPIPNMKFLSVFYNDADVPVIVGPNRKYWIEVDQTKIDNPLLIDDITGNDYLLGKGIAEIKSWASRPVSWAYLKLWSTDWSSNKVDERKRFMVEGNNVDLSDLKRDIVTEWDVSWNEASFFFWNFWNLTAIWDVSLPVDSEFGWVTIQELVNSYVEANLLDEFLATNAEAKAWVVIDKFINPYQLIDEVQNRPWKVIAWTTYTASSYAWTKFFTNTSYAELLSWNVLRAWTYTVQFSLFSGAFSPISYARIYVNNIAVWTERSAFHTTTVFTENITVNAWDKISIYCKAQATADQHSIWVYSVKYDMSFWQYMFTTT